MSLRLRKQTLRKTMVGTTDWVPAPNAYEIMSEKDVGKTRSSLQAWKTPMRQTTWHQVISDGSGKVGDLSGYKSITATAKRGPGHVKIPMGGFGPRSSVYVDSRRPNEKLNYKCFEVEQEPASTTPKVGPGSYSFKRESDIGATRSTLQAWKQPDRKTKWWLRDTACPDDVFQYDVANRASKNRCGGRDSVLWPLQEDQDGNPIFPVLGSRPGTSAMRVRARSFL